VLELLTGVRLKALSHITGGGLVENLPRVLPAHTQAVINCNSWQWPPIFDWLMEVGNIDTEEMYRTFNCGVGLVLVVKADDAEKSIERLTAMGEKAWRLGEISFVEDGRQLVLNK